MADYNARISKDGCAGAFGKTASLWVLVLPTLMRGLGLGEILSVEVAGDG